MHFPEVFNSLVSCVIDAMQERNCKKPYNQADRRRPKTFITEYLVGIKGPLTTPLGEALRPFLEINLLEYYRLYPKATSSVKTPGAVDMVIFQEGREYFVSKYKGETLKASSGVLKRPLETGDKYFPGQGNHIGVTIQTDIEQIK